MEQKKRHTYTDRIQKERKAREAEPKPRRLVIELPEHTFQLLEVLCVGMKREDWERWPNSKSWADELEELADKKNDNFAPGVRALVVSLINSLSTGVERSGSWERGCLDSLTGWDGLLIPKMFGELVDIPNLKPIEEPEPNL